MTGEGTSYLNKYDEANNSLLIMKNLIFKNKYEESTFKEDFQ